MRKYISFFILLLIPFLLQAQGSLSLNTHVKVVGLTRASPPEVFEDNLIFSSDIKARFIGVAFAHERFAILHPMRRNEHGIFFLVYPLPVDMSDPLRYRLVADGQWGYDPGNPDRLTDPSTGVTVSLANVPFISDERPGVYEILAPDGKTARFRYRGDTGLVVTVAGSFNDWDPFMYEMEEVEPGLFELELELPSGRQRYAFIDRGKKVADALNPSFAYTPEGTKVSVLTVR